jgi:His/Glu/Gln/Arg/opine family amino acid ABC transporter permease subunit
MRLDLELMLKYAPLILEGFGLTVAISAASFVIAVIVAMLVAYAATSRNRVLSGLATVYVETIRNLPLLLIVFFLYYVLPFSGVFLPAWFVGVLSISLYAGAYLAEVIRGAIRSVPKGQLESARAIGMSQAQAMRWIIFPQMLGYALPPGTSQTIALIKETSILSTITVPEMTHNAQVVTGITFSPFEVFLMIALLYWAFAAVIEVLGRYLEWRVQPHSRRRIVPRRDPVGTVAAERMRRSA